VRPAENVQEISRPQPGIEGRGHRRQPVQPRRLPQRTVQELVDEGLPVPNTSARA
jgi:hypothetical protein